MWWVNRAIGTGDMPYHFATLYAPGGATNYLHSLNPIEIVLTLPAQWAFGPIFAYNVACWAALSLTAFGGYLLGRDVTGSRAAGLLAGLALGFTPHQFAQLLGHMDVASIQFFVLGVWCLYRSYCSSGKRAITWTLWSAVCLAAAALSHPYSLIYCLFTFPLMGLAWSIRNVVRARERWAPARNALAAVVIGLLVVSPLLLAMGKQLTSPEAPRRRDIPTEISEEREIFSADLAAYVLPSPFHTVWGESARQAIEPVTGGISEKVVFPGYVVMLLALVGLFLRATRRKALFWTLLGFAGFLLSLGPVLRIWGENVLSPMPATLFYLLPGSFMVRVPARFSVLLLLGLSVCAALGMQALLKRRPFSKMPNATYAIVLSLVCLELLPVPYPTSKFSVERWFDKVPGVDRRAAVLEVPFDPGDARPEMWQIASEMPLAGGYLSRQMADPLSDGAPPFPEFNLNRAPDLPAYHRARDTLCRPLPIEESYTDVMRLAGVRYMVLHLDTLSPTDPRIGMAAGLFRSPPVYKSDTLAVYDTGGGEAPASLFGMAEDVEDWFPVESGGARWAFSKPARIHLWSGATRQATLHLNASSFPGERDLTISVRGKLLLSTHIGQAESPISVTWEVPKGFSTLTLSANGPTITPASMGVGTDLRPLSFRISGCSYTR